MPWSGTAARIAHLGKPKAFPGAATRKLALADFARKLPRQRGFLTALVAPEDKQAKLAMTAAIPADRLLLGPDGSAEEGIRVTWLQILGAMWATATTAARGI